MFPSSYFSDRYFTPRFWVKLALTLGAPTPSGGLLGSLSDWPRLAGCLGARTALIGRMLAQPRLGGYLDARRN